MTACTRFRSLATLVAALLLTASAAAAHASGFGVSPLRLELDAKTRSGAITVSNDGAAPLTFQVQLGRWTEDTEARDVYQESEDLVYFPRQFQIPAHESRIIRVGYRNPALEREQAYRLFIEEIPNPGSARPGGTGVAIALRFGVPIFVRPPDASPHGEIAAVTLGRGEARVLVRNPGPVHFRISSVRIAALGADGKPVYEHAVQGWYLLSGAERRYDVPFPLAACRAARSLRVRVSGDGIKLSSALALTPERCSQRAAASGSR